MSTRANILGKDQHDQLWFYRHCDGYPEGTLPLLNKFMEWVKTGKIRDDVGQAAGWLIILGALEYKTVPAAEYKPDEMIGTFKINGEVKFDTLQLNDWKVGSIEPTTGKHGDIEYLYTVDLHNKTITYE